jgi:hypothetical protein
LPSHSNIRSSRERVKKQGHAWGSDVSREELRERLEEVMSKRYEDPVDVEAPEGAIEAFWWRGKRYYVRQVLCRWREASGWWESDADTAQPWARGEAREIWRIDAQPETNGLPPGTYELSHDLRRGTWSLFRIWD